VAATVEVLIEADVTSRPERANVKKDFSGKNVN